MYFEFVDTASLQLSKRFSPDIKENLISTEKHPARLQINGKEPRHL